MTDESPDDEVVALRKRVDRLERRLDREHRARLEAEQIAENGMRSLYDANQDLDRRIAERTEELQHALQVANAAGRAKSGFLAQMSHQIKTPLNGLLGMLELLEAQLDDEQSQSWLASANRSALRLDRLAGRLITYVELENADLRTGAPVRTLDVVLRDAQERWQRPCLRAGQFLTAGGDTDAMVAAPPDLDMLLDEILANAVEFGGHGSVAMQATRIDERTVELAITDPGPGIDPLVAMTAHELEADDAQTSRGDDTVHLGVALVDRIVRGLGGTWELTKSAPHGIVLRLPVSE